MSYSVKFTIVFKIKYFSLKQFAITNAQMLVFSVHTLVGGPHENDST